MSTIKGPTVVSKFNEIAVKASAKLLPFICPKKNNKAVVCGEEHCVTTLKTAVEQTSGEDVLILHGVPVASLAIWLLSGEFWENNCTQSSRLTRAKNFQFQGKEWYQLSEGIALRQTKEERAVKWSWRKYFWEQLNQPFRSLTYKCCFGVQTDQEVKRDLNEEMTE